MTTKLIKIPGKSWFDELTIAEVGLMIDAFLVGGNDLFDGTALTDFIHADVNVDWMKSLQAELREKAFLDKAKGWPEIDRNYLEQKATELKEN